MVALVVHGVEVLVHCVCTAGGLGAGQRMRAGAVGGEVVPATDLAWLKVGAGQAGEGDKMW